MQCLLIEDSSTPTPGGKGIELMKRTQRFGKLGTKMGKGKLGSSLSSVGSMRPGAIPLSIEFGVSGIKVLSISGTNPSSIVAAAFMPTPDDLLDNAAKRLLFQMDALPKFLKGEKINAARATTMIPSGQMVCKHLQLVPADGVPIEQIAGAQLSAQLGCSPGELLVRCRVVKGASVNGKVEVICFAASREFVGRLMGSLKNAKLEPVGIQTEFDAIVKAVELRDGTPGGVGSVKPTLVLDLGSGSTKVLIMHGQEMAFARNIELGARHFDETICHQLRCTMMEARQMREDLMVLMPEKVGASNASASMPGMPNMPTMPASEDESAEKETSSAEAFQRGPQIDMSEPLEIMVDEISMCLRYHSALFPSTRVERLIFVGGQSRNHLVCEHLARTLKLEAQMLDPLACLARSGKVPTSGVDLRTPQPGWAGVVGSALCPMDL